MRAVDLLLPDKTRASEVRQRCCVAVFRLIVSFSRTLPDAEGGWRQIVGLIDYADWPKPRNHVHGRGVDLFRVACERDLEGVVEKWANGSYPSGPRTTSWVKIKNRSYSQMEGRHQPFEGRRPTYDRWRSQGLALTLR